MVLCCDSGTLDSVEMPTVGREKKGKERNGRDLGLCGLDKRKERPHTYIHRR